MPKFFYVVFFSIFVFILMAIIGMHEFGHSMYNRCRYNPEPEVPGIFWEQTGDTGICTMNGLGYHPCAPGTYCGNPYDWDIPLESEGVSDNEQILYGIPTFNNLGSALILINQFISTDEWKKYLYNFIEFDSPAFSVLYSMFNIIIGTFFIVNLFLAVTGEGFVENKEKFQKEQKRMKAHPQIEIFDDEFVLPRLIGFKHPSHPERKHMHHMVKRLFKTPEGGKERMDPEELKEDIHDRKDMFDISLREPTQEKQSPEGGEGAKGEKTEEQDAEKRAKIEERARLHKLKEKRMEERIKSNRIYAWCYHFMTGGIYKWVMTAVIISNCVVQSLDQYPHKNPFDIDQVASAFSFVFIGEFVLKIVAFGFKEHFHEKFHMFELIILYSSFIDVIVTFSYVSLSLNSLTALRTFRMIRLLKVAKIWTTFHSILHTMKKTLKDIGYFFILILLFVLIYAILGMELFAEKVKFNDTDQVDLVEGVSMDTNFDNFHWSVTTVFVLLTEYNWCHIFYQHYRAVGGVQATLYFISLFIVGPRLLFNMFLAILIKDFDEDSKEEVDMDEIMRESEKLLTMGYMGKVIVFVRTKVITPVKHWIKEMDYTPDEAEEKKIQKATLKLRENTHIERKSKHLLTKLTASFRMLEIERSN